MVRAITNNGSNVEHNELCLMKKRSNRLFGALRPLRLKSMGDRAQRDDGCSEQPRMPKRLAPPERSSMTTYCRAYHMASQSIKQPPGCIRDVREHPAIASIRQDREAGQHQHKSRLPGPGIRARTMAAIWHAQMVAPGGPANTIQPKDKQIAAPLASISALKVPSGAAHEKARSAWKGAAVS